MLERTRTEDEVEQALDVLDRKRDRAQSKNEPITANELTARERLNDALLHAREVSFAWDSKSRRLIVQARDLLRDYYADQPQAHMKKDLDHCEQALRELARTDAIDRAMTNVERKQRGAHERNGGLNRGR
ncbi:MAG: hypothetical protein RIM84_18640 [Alphaproteobacteria bacterium]